MKSPFLSSSGPVFCRGTGRDREEAVDLFRTFVGFPPDTSVDKPSRWAINA